jgi:hypothetical protein
MNLALEALRGLRGLGAKRVDLEVERQPFDLFELLAQTRWKCAAGRAALKSISGMSSSIGSDCSRSIGMLTLLERARFGAGALAVRAGLRR